MKYLLVCVFLLFTQDPRHFGSMAGKSRRSNKKHKTDSPSNPLLAAMQETPGLQPKAIPKIKETSLPSATVAAGDNPSLNNPKQSDDDGPSPSSQSSSQSHSSESSQSSSFPDLAVASLTQSLANGDKNGQMSDPDAVSNDQTTESTKATNAVTSETNNANSGLNTDTNNAINGLANEPNGATYVQGIDLNAIKYIQNTPNYKDVNSWNGATDPNSVYYTQTSDYNASHRARGNDISPPGASQVSAPVPIASPSSSAPTVLVLSNNNNNNNTAMNGNLGQPPPELIVPVAVAASVQREESSDKEEPPKTLARIKKPENAISNITKIQHNTTSYTATNTSYVAPKPKEPTVKIKPSPLVKTTEKIHNVPKIPKTTKRVHHHSGHHHHHRHKRRKASKRSKSKRPYSEPVPETGVDKNMPKFDWSKYENMSKLIAQMQGGGSDIPAFNIGKLLSLFPSEVGIRKEDIPSYIQGFMNQEGSLATQDDIAKMDQEAIEADKNQLAALVTKPAAPAPAAPPAPPPAPAKAAAQANQPKTEPQITHNSPPVTTATTNAKVEDKKSSADSNKEQSGQNTASQALSQRSSNTPEKTPEKTATVTADNKKVENVVHDSQPAPVHSPSPAKNEPVKPGSSTPSMVQQEIPPEPPLSLFTGTSQPTSKTTIADTITADTGEKLSESVSRNAGISVPDNIPKECSGLIKSYTNAEMTMKEYLAKMRRCKYINNPNKNRYQQALLKKKGSVSKLARSEAEISQQAYNYAIQRMKDYVPSKKDIADANAILEKWRSSTFGNRPSSKTIVPDVIKSFMSGQTHHRAAAAATAADIAASMKSNIKYKKKDAKSLHISKEPLLSHITGKTGELLAAPAAKNAVEDNGKLTSELVDKTMGLESSANLEVLNSEKSDISTPVASEPKIEELQKILDVKATPRSTIPEAKGKKGTAKLGLPQLSFKDAVAIASAKDTVVKKAVVPSQPVLHHAETIDAMGTAAKKSILQILDKKKNIPIETRTSIPKPDSDVKKVSSAPAISGLVNANLIKALQSMGPGQGFGLLGNKGMTLIATASKRNAENDDFYFESKRKGRIRPRKRSLHKGKRKEEKRGVGEKDNSDNASERSRMDMPPNIQPGPKLMDKIRDMSSVIATP